MRVVVSEEPSTKFAQYAGVSIAFEVSSILDVAEQPPGHFVLTERSIDLSYVKDYDAMDGAQPERWARQFDVSNWGTFLARVDGRHVGGAVIVLKTPGLAMLEGRDDLAVLWDIRVSPEARGQGVGTALFRAAESWAKVRGCRRLKVETQNINVAACRFYARQGCVLTMVEHHAYPNLPNEIQLLWSKELTDGGPSE
jgi:GNAT superfamily N-acetyltransferase